MTKQMTFTRFGKSITVDIPQLPEDRAEYVMDYGWRQSLSDSYAGAKNAEEFEGKLRKRRDAIIAGTVKVAGTGEGRGTPLDREMKRLATDYVNAAAKRKNNKLNAEKRAAYVAMYMARFEEDLRTEAQVNLDAKAAKFAEMAESDDFDDIFAEVPEEEEVEDESTGEPTFE